MSITFIKSGHKYIDDSTGQSLLPSTYFINKFFEKFDTEKWSKHVAQRDGITVEEVKSMWDKKKKYSCDFGTHIHAYAEALIKHLAEPKPIDKKEDTYFKQIKKFFQTEGYTFTDAEKIVGSANIGIAGQVDAVSKKENGIYLIDWKTNKSIDQTGFRDKRALPPIEHLQDCNFSKYSLQLSLYRYILETENNWNIQGLILVHLLPTGDYNKYKVPYLKEEIISMLKHAGKL